MKTCYKCKTQRKFEIEKCQCGEKLVLNTPNAPKLFQALRTIAKGVVIKKN